MRAHELLGSSAALDAGFNTDSLFDARGQQRPLNLATISNSRQNARRRAAPLPNAIHRFGSYLGTIS